MSYFQGNRVMSSKQNMNYERGKIFKDKEMFEVILEVASDMSI